MVAQVQLFFLFFVDMQDSVEEGLHKTLGRIAFPFIKKHIVPAAKESEQICLKLLLQRLEKLSVDEKNSKHLQKMLEQKQFESSWEVERVLERWFKLCYLQYVKKQQFG